MPPGSTVVVGLRNRKFCNGDAHAQYLIRILLVIPTLILVIKISNSFMGKRY